MFLPFTYAINHLGEKITPPASTQAKPVVVGILRQQNQFLLTSRPQGKVWQNYWEFPGGKLEPGETTYQALVRELQEEIGITVTQANPWMSLIVCYPHALVKLYLYQVTAWQGQIVNKEQQQHQWSGFPVTVQPILPGTIPILQQLEHQLINV